MSKGAGSAKPLKDRGGWLSKREILHSRGVASLHLQQEAKAALHKHIRNRHRWIQHNAPEEMWTIGHISQEPRE
jgi:hypothetical protein